MNLIRSTGQQAVSRMPNPRNLALATDTSNERQAAFSSSIVRTPKTNGPDGWRVSSHLQPTEIIMTAIDLDTPGAVSSSSRTAIGIGALIIASILTTVGFACAVPLGAFAAMAAMSFGRRAALLAIGAVWLSNQAWGFAFMHYPMDGETFAWGMALGMIALFSCEAAGSVRRQMSGAVGLCAAFAAAFVAYEGSLIMIDLALGLSGDLALMTVGRIFLINVCAFGALWALKAVAANSTTRRKLTEMVALRHA
jgi:hypothetical protein